MSADISLKVNLELEILHLIQSFERDYCIVFKSIRSKKDKEGYLTGILVNFDEELNLITIKTMRTGVSADACEKIMIGALAIDVSRFLEISVGEILGVEIFNLIEAVESDFDGLFKSIKSKKDKDGMITGITVNFEED